MARIARALGPALCTRVVCIGASVLPLLETEPDVLGSLRTTRDVDAITLTASYWRKVELEQALLTLGFRQVTEPTTHADRWRAPDDTVFDLVSCGDHTGGTGNDADRWVIAHAGTVDLPPLVQHASAVGLLLLKCAAFRDRGAQWPRESKDLADIATLLATRPEIVQEVRDAPAEIHAVLADHCAALVGDKRIVEAVRGHMDDRDPLIDDVAETVLARLREMSLRRDG